MPTSVTKIKGRYSLAAKKGFTMRFDRLGDFLLTQGIYLDEPSVDKIASHYLGNSMELRSTPIVLSFVELEHILELARL